MIADRCHPAGLVLSRRRCYLRYPLLRPFNSALLPSLLLLPESKPRHLLFHRLLLLLKLRLLSPGQFLCLFLRRGS